MSEAVQRLQAAKRQLDEDRHKRGLIQGLRWAEAEATVEDLEGLEEYREQRTCDCCGGWVDNALAGQTILDIFPDSDLEFWERYGLAHCKPAYLRGFIDGALSLWQQVRDHD